MNDLHSANKRMECCRTMLKRREGRLKAESISIFHSVEQRKAVIGWSQYCLENEQKKIFMSKLMKGWH